MSYSDSTLTRHYADFTGIDTSSDPSQIESFRLCECENMYRDYDSGQGLALETFPGYRSLYSFGNRIYGIFSYRSVSSGDTTDYVIVHAKDKLYRFPLAERDSIAGLTPIGTGLAEHRSQAFVLSDKLYLLDGSSYFMLDGEGVFKKIGDSADAYVPILSSNGEPYEQRNLLTEKFKDRYDIYSAVTEIAASDNLIYQIIGDLTCSVIGVTDWSATDIVIPPVATVNGKKYTVARIGANAFAESGITSISIPDTVEVIEQGVCKSCGSLVSLIIPDSVREIFYEAFSGCTALKRVYLGSGIQRLYAQSLAGLEAIEIMAYNGTETEFAAVNIPFPEYFTYTVSYDTPQPSSCILSLSLSKGADTVTSVTLDGTLLSLGEGDTVYYKKNTVDGHVQSVSIFALDRNDVVGRAVEIHGVLRPLSDNAVEGYTSFFRGNPSYTGSAFSAVTKCTLCTVFDGRVFFTGNPDLPNTVFYTAKDLTGHTNPLYFGVYNYFDDGVGNTCNSAVISTGGVMMVMKGDTVQDASVYYHTPKDTGDNLVPKIYPQTAGVAGLGCVGDAVNFLDDPVFVSRHGIEAIGKEQVNLERTVEHRSSNIDAHLRLLDMSRARFAEWRGYLCVLVGDQMFLADSRSMFTHHTGVRQYEWFRLTDIGMREGTEIYKTRTSGPYDFTSFYFNGDFCYLTYDTEERTLNARYDPVYRIAYENFDGEACEGWFFINFDYEYHYCQAVPCYYAGMVYSDEFFPACELLSVNDILLFGCESGHLCCINTDKRGEFEPGETDSMAFGDEELSHMISRRYYTHAGRPYVSGLVTKLDNRALPNRYKSTLPKSCVVKAKSMHGSRFSIRASTDKREGEIFEDISAFAIDFGNVDFDNFSFATRQNTIFVIREREKKWVEKQYRIYSDKIMQPFGLYSISYSYKVMGRIKNEY